MDVHNKHYWGDADGAAGFWGKTTSTANFCEEDYAVSHYIAEFINTISNFAFIYFALRHPNKHGSRTSHGLDYMSWAQLILGINSFIFHATMRHGTQYCDELSMLLLSGALFQGAFTINASPARQNLVNAIVVVLLGVSSAVYLKTGDIFHHVVAFNSILLVFGVRLVYLITMTKDKAKRWGLVGEFGKALVVLTVGYLAWQFDLEECLWLRGVKGRIGLPWAWALELHGWWHVLTALAASQFVGIVRELTP